ncbi:unnamed protein product [Didymodactylos carnosus]|uniref:MATH domain-containing protein n=1 Tax=Didymodactylos carnosus TaxID=1234261 RepID=A0A814GA96_9BILA|nr:unnamed protein product [Didymodactylos carnosus]CAF3765840.1 unnamed protein product [Didymodactylos carnosus]
MSSNDSEQIELDESLAEMNKLCETISVLTNAVHIIQNENIELNNELLQLTNTFNKCQQEFQEIKETAFENNSCINSMQLNQDLMKQELNTLKDNLETTSFDGTYLWKIKSVKELITNAQSEQQISIYSPPFYSSQNGYKMCMKLYLSGDGNARGTHLSLFFVIMHGEFDSVLKWPFSYKITFCLFDQSGQQHHIINSILSNIESNSFQQPQTQMTSASGIEKFFPLAMLQQDGNNYVKNDIMFIKCLVDFNGMPETVVLYSLSINPALPDRVQQSMVQEEISRRKYASVEDHIVENKMET